MNMKFLTLSLFFYSLLNFNVYAQRQDPCKQASGSWDGDYYNYKENCGCHAWYRLYKSNENISFQPVMDGCISGCSYPPQFSATCLNGKLNSAFDGGLSGVAYEGMLELSNSNYYLKLFS